MSSTRCRYSITARPAQTSAPGARAARGHYLALEAGSVTRLLRLEDNVNHWAGQRSEYIRLDEHRVRVATPSWSGTDVLPAARQPHLERHVSNGRQITSPNLEDGDVIRVGVPGGDAVLDRLQTALFRRRPPRPARRIAAPRSSSSSPVGVPLSPIRPCLSTTILVPPSRTLTGDARS